MNNWKEVSREEFFAVIGRKDVTPEPTGDYPYTSLFKTPAGLIEGKIENQEPDYTGGIITLRNKYYLPN